MSAEKQVRLLHMYQSSFASPAGRDVLEDMKRAHNFYSPTVRANFSGQVDPLAMAIAEGERNVILRIIAILESKEGDYHA